MSRPTATSPRDAEEYKAILSDIEADYLSIVRSNLKRGGLDDRVLDPTDYYAVLEQKVASGTVNIPSTGPHAFNVDTDFQVLVIGGVTFEVAVPPQNLDQRYRVRAMINTETLIAQDSWVEMYLGAIGQGAGVPPRIIGSYRSRVNTTSSSLYISGLVSSAFLPSGGIDYQRAALCVRAQGQVVAIDQATLTLERFRADAT